MIEHIIELNKSYIQKLDSMREIINKKFPNLDQPNKVMNSMIEKFNRYNLNLGFKASQLLENIKTDV